MDASALVYSLSLTEVKGKPSSRTDSVDAPNLHGKPDKNAGLACIWEGERGPNGEGMFTLGTAETPPVKRPPYFAWASATT